MHFTREQRESWSETTRDSAFNRWLRSRVSDASGALDLAGLANVAAEFGIDAGRYAHLNPGQQRMNIAATGCARSCLHRYMRATANPLR